MKLYKRGCSTNLLDQFDKNIPSLTEEERDNKKGWKIKTLIYNKDAEMLEYYTANGWVTLFSLTMWNKVVDSCAHPQSMKNEKIGTLLDTLQRTKRRHSNAGLKA